MPDFISNLFSDLPESLPAELTRTLVQKQHVRIERIVSTGQTSPDQFWYDQAEAEWVLVLKGEAILLVEIGGQIEQMHLRPGDCLLLSAHQKHRVKWTSPNEPTVWLAIFFTE